MKAYPLLTGRSVWRLLATLLVSAAFVAGCGMSVDGTGTVSSAGVGSGGTGVFKASLSGAVSDGYLINAIVFLDKNGNYQLDGGEPYSVTGADGSCTLATEPAEMGAYPVVAVALKGITLDSATGQSVANNYLFSFPKESIASGSNIISPLSSQLRELIETGKYATVGQAMEAMARQMQLPAGTNLLADSTAAENPGLRNAAQTIADLMGVQMDQLLSSGGGATPSLDVVRYRTMMALIENNMQVVSKFYTLNNLTALSNSISGTLGTTQSSTALHNVHK